MIKGAIVWAILLVLDLSYRGWTGKKTLYKTLQIIVSALCFLCSVWCYGGGGPWLQEDWLFSLHVGRILYSIFRSRLVKHNVLLSFHAFVFYLIFMMLGHLKTTTDYQFLWWWFMLFDFCGLLKDLPLSPATTPKEALKNVLIKLLPWVIIRIVYFGYSMVVLQFYVSKTLFALYLMVWLAQLKPSADVN
jgi:hypothetical protein